MKFSVFTPSHDLKRISRTLKSLQNQSFKDFEWIICLNGKVANSSEQKRLQEKLKEVNISHNIFLHEAPTDKIGLLKKLCCDAAQGEILVELDHDDELSPDCLEEINLADMQHNADFYYSDDIDMVEETNESIAPYPEQKGWKYYHCPRTNHIASKAFPPDPLSFCYIWFAPNHVRAWKKNFYKRLEGHNEDMDVLDDHELLCRTYIHGIVHHIQKPLYIYWRHDDNTCYGEKNSKIQELTLELHDHFTEEIVKKWCDLNTLKKIDLCCHDSKPDGYLGVDIHPYTDVDIVADLDKTPWPFEDNSVGLFRLQDALEHLRDPIQTMKELYRCLAPHGWALIDVPTTDGRGAFQDPTHVSFWNSNSFWYYTRSQQSRFINTPVKFQLNRISNYYPSEWHETHLIEYTKAHLVKLQDDVIPAGGRDI